MIISTDIQAYCLAKKAIHSSWIASVYMSSLLVVYSQISLVSSIIIIIVSLSI